MQVMNIRRAGNSNVVSLPHALERLGYTTSTMLLVDALPDGALCSVPTDQIRTCMADPDQPGMAARPDVRSTVADAAGSQPVGSSSSRVPS